MNDVFKFNKNVDNYSYSFTKDQEAAISGIIDFIAEPFNPV